MKSNEYVQDNNGRLVRPRERLLEIPYDVYFKQDNGEKRMFDRALLSFEEAAALTAEWSYQSERAHRQPRLERHCDRVIAATTQLTHLAEMPLWLVGDYCCTFTEGDDEDRRYNFLLPNWSLFHPLPACAWPENPAVPPFAVMGGMGLFSPIPIEGLKGFATEYPLRTFPMKVSQRFITQGGWHTLRDYAQEWLDEVGVS